MRVVGRALPGYALLDNGERPLLVWCEAALRAATSSLHASLQAPEPTLDEAHLLIAFPAPGSAHQLMVGLGGGRLSKDRVLPLFRKG
jgi:hypothetical protein